MRTRAWRRYMEEVKVTKRLKLFSARSYYWYFQDRNNTRISNPLWCDYVGIDVQFMFKTHTTKKHDSKFKTKYSPNKTKGYWAGDVNRTRDKIQFKKMLDREYGLKHFNTK